jgi:hypothetical protein
MLAGSALPSTIGQRPGKSIPAETSSGLMHKACTPHTLG